MLKTPLADIILIYGVEQQDYKAYGKSTDSCPGCSCGMTCQEVEPLDEYVKCTCNTDCGESQLINSRGDCQRTCQETEPSDKICRMPQQDYKACGKIKSTNSCPGCSNACICRQRRTKRCGMTCQEAEPLDEYGECTCNTDCGESQLINLRGDCQRTHQEAETLDKICRLPQQDYRACGKIKSTNSCPGCSNACVCRKRRTERCGMTCQEAEPLDEYGKCTCNTDCGESQLINSCGCCKIRRMPQQNYKACGKIKSTNSCPGYSNAYIYRRRRTKRCGMTCQEAEPLDEYGKCTCNTDCGESQLINLRGCGRICRMPRQDTYKPNVQEMEQESLIFLSTSQ